VEAAKAEPAAHAPPAAPATSGDGKEE